MDLTSYTIRSLDPISLAGAGKGSGGLCGSSFLNRIFAKYLQDKMRSYTGGWDQGALKYAMDEFERKIKREFTNDDEETYTIMMRGLPDSRQHGLNAGNLVLSGKELRKYVFDPVISNVMGLVRDQINNTTGHVKAILLAGGFGQSYYLQQQLKQIRSVKDHKIPIWPVENRYVRGLPNIGLLSNLKKIYV